MSGSSPTEKFYFSPSCFPYRHQNPMAHPVEWSMDTPHDEWTYDGGMSDEAVLGLIATVALHPAYSFCDKPYCFKFVFSI